MSENKNVTEALRAAGIDPDALSPDVHLELIRAAARTTAGEVRQLTREELRNMSPAEVTAAEEAGRLDNLLGRSTK